MATEKTLNTRIKLRYDSHENWTTNDPVLYAGEVALSTVSVQQAGTVNFVPSVLIKVGDGTHKYSELDFAYAKAADVLAACKTEDALKAFVNGVIANAGIATSTAMEALAGRVTTAEGEIDALQAELNTAETGLKARVTTAEGAIDALEALVGEKNVATQINEAIAALNLANTYEAKGEAAKVQTALETYKTTNDAAVLANTNASSANTAAITAIKDGTTIDSFADVEAALAGKETSGAAAQALTDAKAYADGLAGNYDAKGAAATAESNAKAYAKEYADGLAGNYDAAGSAAQALTDAKDYTDGEIAEWVGEKNVATQISEAIANEKLADTYAAKVHTHVKADITDFAHNHEMSEVNGLADALAGKQEVGDYATKAEAQGYADAKDEAIAAAKKAGDDAQADVDALESYVGTIPEEYTESNVIAYVNKKAEETLAAAQGGSSETAASVKAALDTYKSENNAKVQANTDAIAVLEGLVGDTAVATQISDAVADEAEAREAADAAQVERIAALEGTIVGLSGAMHFEGVKDEVPTDVTGYEQGDVIIVGNKEYVLNGSAFVEFGDASVNAEAITALTGRVTTAEGKITTLEGEMDDVQAAVATKAEAADLTALAGRVTTVEGDLNAETTGLKARMTAAEADIDALEGLVGDGNVSDRISTAINELKNGQLTTMQGEIDAVEGRADALEAKAHEHANKTVLDGISAEKVTAWDAAVQTVTAGTGLTATKTGTDVAINIDDTVTWVFDCGDSTNV